MKNGPGVGGLDPVGIQGVDWGAGVVRWGGETAYRQALRGFARRHARDGERVRAALERCELDGAKALVHAVKGGAGAVAATGLEKAARALEWALDVDGIPTGPLPAGLVVRLEGFESALSGVVAVAGPDVNVVEAVSARCAGQASEAAGPEAQVGIGEMIDRLRLGRIQGVEEGLCALGGAGVVSRSDLERWLEMLEDLELESLLVALRRINPGGSF
ncbi:MAG: Hpt domain-containing protein [Magnetococcales bacterium]|nr:Hpt domain-containing protein [Magnetococcales bacterium]